MCCTVCVVRGRDAFVKEANNKRGLDNKISYFISKILEWHKENES